MLVLTLNEGEAVQVGETRVVLVATGQRRCRLGFEAPQEIRIMRTELVRRSEKPQPEPGPAYRPCCLPIGEGD